MEPLIERAGGGKSLASINLISVVACIVLFILLPALGYVGGVYYISYIASIVLVVANLLFLFVPPIHDTLMKQKQILFIIAFVIFIIEMAEFVYLII